MREIRKVPEINEEHVETKKTELQGLVFDIQGHSVHDGPGTRTTVFLNGCPLDCIWCCNPEGLFHQSVMMYKESKCVKCGKCIKACPYNAITVVDGKLKHNREFCDKCTSHECVEACLKEATDLSGKYYTISEMMRIFDRHRHFWGSRGGVTFSGGEPLLQRNFILPLLKECKKAYIHVAIETTSCIGSNYFMDAMNYIDWVFTDIKHMDSEKHKEVTGVGNELILKNIKTLAEKENWEGFIVPRIPVIPGYNDSEENIKATARFIKSIDLEVINILPFHRLGESKYRQVGQVYRFAEQVPPTEEHMLFIKKIVEEEGLVCFVGYETPF